MSQTPLLYANNGAKTETQVLVVDNDAKWWETVQILLKDRKFVLKCVASPGEATTILDKDQFDVIILNMSFRDTVYYLEGFEVLKKVRDMRAHTQCIILTGAENVNSDVLLNQYDDIVCGIQRKGELNEPKDEFVAKYDKACSRAQRVNGNTEPRMRKKELAYEDRRLLALELNKRPEWANGKPNDRKAVLLDIGLPEDYASSYPFSDIPATDTQMMLANLQKLDVLENRPGFSALGALAEYLWRKAADSEGRIFLAYLILHYDLILDGEFREQVALRCPPLPLMAEKYSRLDLGWAAKPPAVPWQGPADPEVLRGALEQNWSKRARYLSASFLSKGARAARAVCLIELADGWAAGTGFAVGPDLVLTNSHVLPDDSGAGTRVRFGFRLDEKGQLQEGRPYEVERILRRSPETLFDYAILQVAGEPGNDPGIGYLPLQPRKAARVGGSAFIIQHPNGRPQQLVLQDNWITYVSEDGCRIQYLTNTDYGSSGSPVCDENWNVIGLHHARSPVPKSAKTDYIRGNEGIPIAAFYDAIKDLLP